jgi:hypothetical protein
MLISERRMAMMYDYMAAGTLITDEDEQEWGSQGKGRGVVGKVSQVLFFLFDQKLEIYNFLLLPVVLSPPFRFLLLHDVGWRKWNGWIGSGYYQPWRRNEKGWSTCAWFSRTWYLT